MTVFFVVLMIMQACGGGVGDSGSDVGGDPATTSQAGVTTADADVSGAPTGTYTGDICGRLVGGVDGTDEELAAILDEFAEATS